MSAAEMLLPAKIGNFTDFVCSTFHAQRAVRNPRDSPVAPVLTYMPVAYHGRASSIRVSGEDIRRSQGQFKDSEGVVLFGPSKALDFQRNWAYWFPPELTRVIDSHRVGGGAHLWLLLAQRLVGTRCPILGEHAGTVPQQELVHHDFSVDCQPGSTCAVSRSRFPPYATGLAFAACVSSIRKAIELKVESTSSWKRTSRLQGCANLAKLRFASSQQISSTPIGASPK